MTKWLVAAVFWLFIVSTGAAYDIAHVEPSSWWVGMKDGRLQLLVHGNRVAGLEPAIDYPGVAVARVVRTDNPNYLFVDLTIAEATRPGRFRIEFRRGGTTVLSHDYTLHVREAGSAARAGFSPADVIYLITPDRFANGDPANDRVVGYRQGPDRRDPDGRHGGDLQGVLDHLDYIAGMGFTQIWLNPVLENDQPQASYHGYATTDFYRIDARLGDNALYRELARQARARGIGLIMDVILNHCGSEHWWMKDPPSQDWINHGGRFVGTSHERDSLLDPHGTEEDRRRFSDGWFVPTMPDLNQRNPLLATYLIQNSLWWIEFAGLSGLRVDTWSYADRNFLAEWARRLTDEYPRLNIVGEEWSADPAFVSRWQRGSDWSDGYRSYLPGLLDFPLQDAVARGLREDDARGAGLQRIQHVLASDFLYPDPDNLVVFPENHDMSRLYTQLGERLGLYKMAIAFFLTTRGIPQLYYGSEILLTSPGPKSDGRIRGDFPGGWTGDPVNGFTGTGLTAAQREAQDFTRRLLRWRSHAEAIHHGKLTQYAPQDDSYVYFRHAGEQKVMVVINKSAQDRRIDTARFQEVIGKDRVATDVLSGRRYPLDMALPVASRGVMILELGNGGDAPSGVTNRFRRRSSAG